MTATEAAGPTGPVGGGRRDGFRAAAAVAVLAVLLVAAVVVALALPRGPAAASPGDGASDGPRGATVVLIGDSITEGSQGTLRRALSGSDVAVRAESGRTLAEMLPAAREAGRSAPDVAIVNLGSNDVLLDRPPEETVEALRAVVDAFPASTCLRLVTVNERFLSFGDRDRQAPARWVNDQLRAEAARAGAGIVDWADLVRRHEADGEPGGPATVDSIHPTPTGQAILGRAYARAALDCPAAAPGPAPAVR